MACVNGGVCARAHVHYAFHRSHITITIPHITTIFDINSLIISAHYIALKHPHFMWN